MELTSEQRSEYANAVWDAFLEKRQDRLTMTPAEFALVQLWMREIPLRVVLQAMEQTAKPGRTLAYYGPSVLAEYRRWKASLSA